MIISTQHKTNIPVRKILIIQLGDIGDVVWAIPAFWAVKNAFPQADVSVLTRKPNGYLLLDDPHIDTTRALHNYPIRHSGLDPESRKSLIILDSRLRTE